VSILWSVVSFCTKQWKYCRLPYSYFCTYCVEMSSVLYACRISKKIEIFVFMDVILTLLVFIFLFYLITRRSQWPCCLRGGSVAARLLWLRVRISPEAWVSVSCECCVLSGRGLCAGLIPRPEESYRVCLRIIVKPW